MTRHGSGWAERSVTRQVLRQPLAPGTRRSPAGRCRGWRRAVSGALLLLLSLVPLSLHAEPADAEAHVREIAQQLRCPVCQGLSVADSPSELAHEMRTLVREQLQQGKTPAEVLDYFVQRYGEWILLAPPKRGFNLVIWVLPFALLPAGAMAVYLGARRWVRRGPAIESPPPTLETPDAERLKRELDAYN